MSTGELFGGHIDAGAPVVDANGVRIGTVRAVYPHYVAVADSGESRRAYRVPIRAVASLSGGELHLNVPREVLDPMTPQDRSALGLPEHGGDIVQVPPLDEAAVEAIDGTGVVEEKA